MPVVIRMELRQSLLFLRIRNERPPMPSSEHNKDENNDDRVRVVVMSFLKVPLPRLHRKEEIYIVACALALFLRLLYCINFSEM